jgi:lantibiotic modifying enzyme
MTTDRALEVAHRIGRHLADQAVWSGDRCTWLGMTQDADEDSDQVEFCYGTLGPDLYGGTSGIALFLLECWSRTADPRLRETAVGALRQAEVHAPAIPLDIRWGLFEGWIGLAWVLARAGILLQREDLLAECRGRISGLGDPPERPAADLLSGASGAIPPLLGLARKLEWPALRDQAITLGRGVIARAERDGGRWIWPVPAGRIEAARSLTGLAHGAAGIGWSLLELARETGDSSFLSAARGAFQYENEWFRAGENNWPDFREEADPVRAPSCIGWCHGAPGIALTRIRAVALGLEEYRSDARAALATTRNALADRDEWIEGDLSLCHGRAGLGEVLRSGAPVMLIEGTGELIEEAAEDPVERYGFDFEAWPCGVRRGSNPSLMLGLAGIGCFYLGLADPGLSSVLLPGAG